MPPNRDRLLTLDDAHLLAECRVDVFRGSGRGGQKRNVTDSAVRITHEATGLSAVSDETRSQIHNRKTALRLLRREIALNLRQPVRAVQHPGSRHLPGGEPCPSARGTYGPDSALSTLAGVPGRKTLAYLRWMAQALDTLEEHGYAVGQVAQKMGLGTGKFIKALAADTALWQRVNQKREQLGLKRLRP